MKRLNRAEFLQSLEAVQPGLSNREIIEQSSCFVFQGKTVTTFNDEVACRQPVPIKLTGAVQAAPLLSLLRKMLEDEIAIDEKDGHLVVYGKKREGGVRMEKEILLPVDKVDTPKTWQPIHPDFLDAVNLVQQCASRDESQFHLTCLHISPKWIEACDNYQAVRYKVKTKVKEPTLVRHWAIAGICSVGMTEFAETESWLHFRNPSTNLVYSCRRFLHEYPVDISGMLETTGSKTVLPKGLAEAADRAMIFSAEDKDNNVVLVSLKPGRLRIRGQSVSGYYHESRKIAYDGEAMEFVISPELLIELTKRHNDCEIGPGALIVDGGKYRYISCLENPNDAEEPEAEEADEDQDA